MGRLVLITPNATRLVSVAQAKAHCRFQSDAENDLIAGLIAAAETYCRDYTSRAFLTSGYRWLGERFPVGYHHQEGFVHLSKDGSRDGSMHHQGLPYHGLDLLVSPVQSVTSVTYYDTSGVLQTITDAQLMTSEIAPKLYPAPGSYWPATQYGRVSAVSIDFIAGYTDASLVPPQITQAMLLMIGQWFKDRENGVKQPNMAADMLLNQVISERYV